MAQVASHARCQFLPSACLISWANRLANARVKMNCLPSAKTDCLQGSGSLGLMPFYDCVSSSSAQRRLINLSICLTLLYYRYFILNGESVD